MKPVNYRTWILFKNVSIYFGEGDMSWLTDPMRGKEIKHEINLIGWSGYIGLHTERVY